MGKLLRSTLLFTVVLLVFHFIKFGLVTVGSERLISVVFIKGKVVVLLLQMQEIFMNILIEKVEHIF